MKRTDWMRCVVWLVPAAEGNIDSREDKRFRIGARYVVTVGKGHAGAADGYGDDEIHVCHLSW
jgi:hypothetical protein